MGFLQEQGVVQTLRYCPADNRVYLTSASILGSLGLWSGPAKPQSRQFLDLEAYKATGQDVDSIVLEDNGKTVERLYVLPQSVNLLVDYFREQHLKVFRGPAAAFRATCIG